MKNLTTQKVVAIAIGAALFGVLMVYGSIPIATNTKLSTAYIVPIIVGGMFGIVPAALVGLIGNVIADSLGGWGYWWDWTIGNFFACFFIGSLSLYGAKIREGIFTPVHAVIFAVVSVLGNAISFGFITPIFTKMLYGGELSITLLQAQAAVISNSAVIIIVGIPILFILAKRYKAQTNLTVE